MPRVYKPINRPPLPKGRLDEDRKSRVQYLIEAGFSNPQIIEDTGISVATLTRYRANVRKSGSVASPRPGQSVKPSAIRTKQNNMAQETVTFDQQQADNHEASDSSNSLRLVGTGLKLTGRSPMLPLPSL